MDEDRLRRAFINNEPEEVRNYLAVIRAGGITFGGTVVTPIGSVVLPSPERPRGITFSETYRAPASEDFTAAYVTLDDYTDVRKLSDGSLIDADWLRDRLAQETQRDSLLIGCAVLNHLAHDRSRLSALAADYIALLQPTPAARLRALLDARGERPARTVLLSRQPLLVAMRRVLQIGVPDAPEHASPQLPAIFLAHAVGIGLDASPEDDGTTLGRWPSYLVLETVRSGLLHQSHDPFMAIDRSVRLWRDYGERLVRTNLHGSPAQLLREATGLDLDDLLVIGFWIFVHLFRWELGEGFLLPNEVSRAVPPHEVDALLRLVARTPDEILDDLPVSPTRFDFLAFQQTPILRLPRGLLVLDETFLLDRVTRGLYWDVHDHEKSAHGESARRAWTQAYGEMVEAMVVDYLRDMAPRIVGGGVAFYSEDDIGRSYRGKKCDGAIDFGGEIALFEVVSGQPKTATRIGGSRRAFEEDTERLVMKKCRQLDAVARAIHADQTALTGRPPVQGMKTPAIVVAGGGYPVNFLTMPYIEGRLRSEDLLQDARVGTIAIIDLDELEMLVALNEGGASAISLIKEWKSSPPLSDGPLKNFLLDRYGRSGPTFRPLAVRDRVLELIEQVVRQDDGPGQAQ